MVGLSYKEKIEHTPCREKPYKKVDIGDTVGRLTLVEVVGKSKNGSRIFSCMCACGGKIDVIISSLNSGLTQSCGCLKEETKHIKKATHGMSNQPEYTVWCGMKERCYNPKTSYYYLYGGKGVTVCDRWLGEFGFRNFYEDMGKRPKNFLIDRINPDGNYEPSNCRWVDAETSARNTGLRSNNTSGKKGVSWHSKQKKWQASIRVDGKHKYLGVFENLDEAILARSIAEEKFNYYGDWNV